jgi:hypothetical protein
MCSTTPIGDAMATVAFSEGGNAANQDILFYQYFSLVLTAGQTITGAQSLKFQAMAIETSIDNNMFHSMGIRVVAANGTTIQKTVLAVSRGSTEYNAATLINRSNVQTSAATNYTTVAGDRLVFEVGAGGLPKNNGFSHSCSLRLGDSAASDLPEDTTTTTDLRPWVQLTDTLTFVAAGKPRQAMHQVRMRRVG